MGIVFVLILWAIVGGALAAAGALAAGCLVAFLTRGALQGRKTLIIAAILFPFLCFAWAGAVFVFQAVVNETILHRDAGLGDSWRCPLPNGYALLMIDTTDQGWVYNPKTQPGDGVGEQEDAIASVRLVQVAGPYILGGSDSHGFDRPENQSSAVDSYFLLDTRTGKRTGYPSYEALRDKARELGFPLNLAPINAVYSQYRFTWFEVIVGLVLCVPLLVGAVLLVRWIVRVRRTRRRDAKSAESAIRASR